MRIEKHNGHKIVCGHIYPANEVKVGSQWMGSSGSKVTVTKKRKAGELTWVSYEWKNSDGTVSTHEKDSFSFQCRYCLIVD